MNKKNIPAPILILLSMLLCFFTLELILRIYPSIDAVTNAPYSFTKITGVRNFCEPFGSYTQVEPVRFDKRGYYKKSGGIIKYYFNQFGARWVKPGTQDLKAENIVVLGDSFTYGDGLRYEDTYIFRLQTLLQKSGINMEFVNFSRPASDSERCLRIYRQKRGMVPHKAVVYGLNINDLILFPACIVSDFKYHDFRIRKLSKAVDFVFKRIEQYRSRIRNIKKLTNPSAFEQDYFIKNMNAIKQMKSEAGQAGADFYVVILPILVDIQKDTFKPVYDKIKDSFKEYGIKYFDLTTSVSSYKDSNLWILPFDQHPNEIASEIFAERLCISFKDVLNDASPESKN